MKRIEPSTSKAPSTIASGEVYTTNLIAGDEAPQVRVGRVHYSPGARTAWHTHAGGEYLHIEEGVALLQERGGKVRTLYVGDTVFTEPNTEHWHGAAEDAFMVHLAIWGAPAADEESETIWGQHVSEADLKSD